MTPSPRVQFIHGLESSPHSDKALFFAAHFTALTPAMDTSDFAGCAKVQAAAIAEFHPDIVVGSSFGGAVLLELIGRGAWRGPTLMLAPAIGPASGAGTWAGIGRWGGMTLPSGQSVVIVHGTADDVVPIDVSRAFAAQNAGRVQLVEVDDGHRLGSLVTSGRLADYVRAVLRASGRV